MALPFLHRYLPLLYPLYIIHCCCFAEFHATRHCNILFYYNCMSVVELFHSHYTIHRVHVTHKNGTMYLHGMKDGVKL
jgi:hypothetical protein